MEDLSVFERFVVELLKAVVAGSRLIVLNEISTLINEAELGKLHSILRHYAAEGISFLYVCFHFEELLQISDRTAVMMQGRVVKLLEGEEMIP
ncbi:MAG: sugar ABC transporter ATP-binding protein, partial [Christensenellaceae bacterium]|nr:sugar ABC transporter ATP-binding protein [Christensenellaceae bacterium]